MSRGGAAHGHFHGGKHALWREIGRERTRNARALRFHAEYIDRTARRRRSAYAGRGDILRLLRKNSRGWGSACTHNGGKERLYARKTRCHRFTRRLQGLGDRAAWHTCLYAGVRAREKSSVANGFSRHIRQTCADFCRDCNFLEKTLEINEK